MTRRHLALDEVGSTNTVALEAARAGDPGPLWITAGRQVMGRGRRARPWVSERGNLFASLLLIDPAPREALSNLPLVVSLGVRNGLSRLLDGVRIKWPNDIHVRGRKCAGILIESERLADGRTAVVAGCGVNVEHAPDGTPNAATALALEGCRASVRQVFGDVAAGVEAALALWDRGHDFRSVRAAWLDHATGIGEPCRVNLHDGSLEGVFSGLDDDGRLVLAERGGSTRTISAGDLFLPSPEGRAARYSDEAVERPR